MTKILSIGDIHLKNSSLPDFPFLEGELGRIIEESQPDVIVLHGDLFNDFEKMSLPVWNTALRLIGYLADLADVYILVGNHDMLNASAYCTDHHYLNAFKTWENVKVVDRPQVFEIGGHQVLMTCYMPPGKLVEYIAQNLADQISNIKAVFAHQELLGCKMGAIVSEHGDDWPSQYPMIVTGHIHDFEVLRPNAIIVGTPCFTSFGETTDRFILELTLQPDKIFTTKHKMHMPRRITIKTDVAGLSEIALNHPKDLIRILVEDYESKIETFKKSKKYKTLQSNPSYKVVLRPVSERKILSNTRSLKFHEILAEKAQANDLIDFYTQVKNAFKPQ